MPTGPGGSSLASHETDRNAATIVWSIEFESAVDGRGYTLYTI
jgi:hypothetical protein